MIRNPPEILKCIEDIKLTQYKMHDDIILIHSKIEEHGKTLGSIEESIKSINGRVRTNEAEVAKVGERAKSSHKRLDAFKSDHRMQIGALGGSVAAIVGWLLMIALS